MPVLSLSKGEVVRCGPIQRRIGVYDVAEDEPPQPAGMVLVEGGTLSYFRGGSWFYSAGNCTVSIRDVAYPDYRNFNFGFRLARSSGN